MSNFMKVKGKASTLKTTFSITTSIAIDIQSDAAIVWALLTNASDYTRWNSTITSLTGEIKKGEKVKLKSYLDSKRVFKITIKDFIAESSMTWGDGQGNRVFTITQNGNNSVSFTMVEKIGGIMFPLYVRFLPPFEESFEKFAEDLKKEAEAISSAQ